MFVAYLFLTPCELSFSFDIAKIYGFHITPKTFRRYNMLNDGHTHFQSKCDANFLVYFR